MLVARMSVDEHSQVHAYGTARLLLCIPLLVLVSQLASVLTDTTFANGRVKHLDHARH